MASDKADVELDVFGQKLGMNIYTQLTWCFRTTGVPDRERYVQTIQRGLARLSTAFPWIAGSVIVEGASDGNPGVAKIRLPKTPPSQDEKDRPTARLVVSRLEDFKEIDLGIGQLVTRDFPMDMLHEDLIAPCRTIPIPRDGSSQAQTEAESLVFLLQLSFVKGGVLLTFVGHHAVMDMTCQGELIRLLDEACEGRSFSDRELRVGNCERASLIPTLSEKIDFKSVLRDQLITPPTASPNDGATEIKEEAASPAACSWQSFNFTPSALSTIKSLASQGITKQGAYISTDDALTSFIWQSVTRIRSKRLLSQEGTQTTSLARAIDARRYLNLDPATPGLIQNMTYHTFSIQSLLDQPLSTTALALRHSVDPKTSDVGFRTKALATYLSQRDLRKHNDISFTARLDTSKDLAISTWSKVKANRLTFGLGLGWALAVRRPAFTPYEGLIYLMPRDEKGFIAVAMCLKDEELEGLKADAQWKEFTIFE